MQDILLDIHELQHDQEALDKVIDLVAGALEKFREHEESSSSNVNKSDGDDSTLENIVDVMIKTKENCTFHHYTSFLTAKRLQRNSKHLWTILQRRKTL